MSISGLITPDEINAVMDKINSEASRRGVSTPALTHVNTSEEIDDQTLLNMVNKNNNINNSHCYCESDGEIAVHNGGTPLSLTINSGDIVGEVESSDINGIDLDSDSLIAQSNCGTFIQYGYNPGGYAQLLGDCPCPCYYHNLICTGGVNGTPGWENGVTATCGCHNVCYTFGCTCDLVYNPPSCSCDKVCNCEYGG